MPSDPDQLVSDDDREQAAVDLWRVPPAAKGDYGQIMDRVRVATC